MNQAGGHLSSGLTVVAYELETVAPGCGGMGAIPGSHKSNFLLDPDTLGLPDGGRIRDLQLPPWATAVPVEKGDAIIFTEALYASPRSCARALADGVWAQYARYAAVGREQSTQDGLLQASHPSAPGHHRPF